MVCLLSMQMSSGIKLERLDRKMNITSSLKTGESFISSLAQQSLATVSLVPKFVVLWILFGIGTYIGMTDGDGE